ncbi:MAG: hypothetical protein Q8R63_02500 [Ramlibacter sp.]|nr:hypothetical protein [Ramlibacter sp.]
MRGRLILIILLSAVAFGFAGLNWSEVTRTTPLSFGILVSEGSVGLVLLTLLAVTLISFLISSGAQETRHQIDYGKTQRTLQAQRDLADNAETSRYTELQKQLDAHLRDNRQREAIAATEFERSLANNQRELRSQLEAMSQLLGTRLREIENRIDGRLSSGATGVTSVNLGPHATGPGVTTPTQQSVIVPATYDPDQTRPHSRL